MAKRPVSRKMSKPMRVFSWALISLVLLGFVVGPLARGALFYQNYRGEAVFVPFVILVGVVMVIAAIVGSRNR